MHKGRGYRYAQPYTASNNWVGDSRLAAKWVCSGVFNHIDRPVEFGPLKTSRFEWENDPNRFEWTFRMFSDVGEPFNCGVAMQMHGHGLTWDISFVVSDSAQQRGGWFGSSPMAVSDWRFGNILKGPWSFAGDEVVYRPGNLILVLVPLTYKQEL